MYIAYSFILGLIGGFVISAIWGVGEVIAEHVSCWLDKLFPLN